MNVAKFEYQSDGIKAQVKIDDRVVRGIQSVGLEHKARGVPVVKIQMASINASRINLNQAQLSVDLEAMPESLQRAIFDLLSRKYSPAMIETTDLQSESAAFSCT